MEWAISVHQILNGGISLGQAISKDSNGVYNEFNQDNSTGVLLRIGPSGGTEQKYNWTTSNTGIAINHNLVDLSKKPRQPIGFHVVDSDKQVSVYRTATPTDTTINLAPTDATATVTVYIF
jgi:hypothetical protein